MPLPDKNELAEKELTQDHLTILNHIKGLARLSRQKMVEKYSDWDHYDDVYRGVRQPDVEDKKAKDKQMPLKMVVPIGFAQLQTFASFCLQVFTQREYFYDLIGSSPEDFKASNYGEALLQRDLDHNKFTLALYQYLIDIGRFGFGVMKCHWVEQKQFVDESTPAKEVGFMGLKLTLKSAKVNRVEKVKYQGNKITCISPYRFFPDPRLPLSRFQEGEFCASEEEYSFQEMKQMETEGVCFGIDHVPPFKFSPEDPSRKRTRFGFIDPTGQIKTAGLTNSKPAMLITEMQVKIVPAQFKLDGKPVGPEDYPVKYLVWLANDARIVRFEPLNYLHDEFTYCLAELTPDMNHFLNAGLFEVIDELQDTITWFINSHITSVRKTIQNRLVVDPQGVEMDDLAQHKPVIRLRPDASRSGVERWVKQLEVQDVTAGHIGDASELHSLVQVVTGINENLLGQFHGGRRSATEARNVTTSAASRIKTFASLIWTSGLEPLGRQMLSNLRDGLTSETYVRMFGSAATQDSFQEFKKLTREDLVGNYDFALFDGTLPSEKSYVGDVMIQILEVIMSNPQVMRLVGLDPKLLLYEVMRLKGIKYPERFAVQNNMQNAQPAMEGMMQQLMANNGNPAVRNTPNGQAPPVSQGAGDESGNSVLNNLFSPGVGPG